MAWKVISAVAVTAIACAPAVTAAAQPGSARPAVAVHLAAAAHPGSAAHLGSAARANAKKGVSVWTFRGVGTALKRSGASWYYTWAAGHSGVTSPPGVQFVPMIWGAGNVTAATLRQVKRQGHDLLAFNEPDSRSQANLTVSRALSLWPRLMGTGMQLGSPAVADDAATPGGWLDQFMRGAGARHYRVNFITVHWYGSDFATRRAVGQLRSYLQAIHNRYHKPLWLTEFALIRFGSTVSFPTSRQQAAFVTAATSMLEHLSFVQRYAWFALPATPGDGSAGLFRPGAAATAAGRAFEAVDKP